MPDEQVIIHSVAIPVELNHYFVPSDMERVMNYYPNYVSRALRTTNKPLSFSGYMCFVAHAIEFKGCNGYTLSNRKVLSDYIKWIGVDTFLRMGLGYKAMHDGIVRAHIDCL